MTKVSIIIPVYNGEKYLKEAIDSALNQSYKDIEVIVIDDCSTDGSLSIAESFGSQIILREQYDNQGTASTLNFGIKVAQGDWIKWLSADDVLLPQAIESMLWCVLAVPDPANHIFYTNYHIIDQNGKHKMDWIEPETPPDLWDRFYGNGSTSLIHKSIFEKCDLFDETLAHSEDYEFWLRATQLHGISLTLIPIFTINYRNHPDQLTNTVGGTLDKQIKDSIKQRLPPL